MRLHLASLLLSLSMACGVPEAVNTPPSDVYAVTPVRRVEHVILPTWSSPGWHLQPEPALESFGRLMLSSITGNGLVWMQSSSRLPAPVVVAVKWGVEPPVEFARLSDGSWQGSLPIPPPSARALGRCETAQGLLLVYESDGQPFVPRAEALVGISSKGDDPAQFPAVQREDNFVVSWSSCTGFEGFRSRSMLLQRDPHLANAICEGRCCATAFPRTLITAANLELLPNGGTRFTPRIDQSMQLPQTIEVNGVTVPLGDGVLSTDQLSPWRVGENQVSMQSGSLEPWTATVVLPAAALNLRVLSSLDQLAPVRVAWDGGDWATAFLISIRPEASVRAYVPEYVWMQEDVRDGVQVPWEGFRWNNVQVSSPVATVRLVARHLASHSARDPSTAGGLFDLSVHAEQTLRLQP